MSYRVSGRLALGAGLSLVAIGSVLLWRLWLGPPPASGWQAGASVFSGRPDPTWVVPATTALQLERLWLSLPLSTDSVPPGPGLGYRGGWLRDPSGREWRAFAGLVEITTGKRQVRQDPRRTFEHRLLQTAPAGILPHGLP